MKDKRTKYDEAVERNLNNLAARLREIEKVGKGKSKPKDVLAVSKYGEAKLPVVKMYLGIAQNDNAYDEQINGIVAQIKHHFS